MHCCCPAAHGPIHTRPEKSPNWLSNPRSFPCGWKASPPTTSVLPTGAGQSIWPATNPTGKVRGHPVGGVIADTDRLPRTHQRRLRRVRSKEDLLFRSCLLRQIFSPTRAAPWRDCQRLPWPDRAHSIQTLEIECDLPGAAGWDRRETPLRHGNQGCALISSIVDPPRSSASSCDRVMTGFVTRPSSSTTTVATTEPRTCISVAAETTGAMDSTGLLAAWQGPGAPHRRDMRHWTRPTQASERGSFNTPDCWWGADINRAVRVAVALPGRLPSSRAARVSTPVARASSEDTPTRICITPLLSELDCGATSEAWKADNPTRSCWAAWLTS